MQSNIVPTPIDTIAATIDAIFDAAIADARRRADEAQAERTRIRGILGKRAAQIYRGAGTSTPLAQMDVSSVSDFAKRRKYAAAAADHDQELIAKLHKVQEDLDARRAGGVDRDGLHRIQTRCQRPVAERRGHHQHRGVDRRHQVGGLTVQPAAGGARCPSAIRSRWRNSSNGGCAGWSCGPPWPIPRHRPRAERAELRTQTPRGETLPTEEVD